MRIKQSCGSFRGLSEGYTSSMCNENDLPRGLAEVRRRESGLIACNHYSPRLVSSRGGTMDAIVQGTGAGLELLVNIVAMLIVFVALVYLANAVLGLLPDFLGSPLTL